MPVEKVKVLIVGAGPTGLAAALQLHELGVKDVLIVEREPEAGGIPRLCHHVGFGLRDLHRATSGPRYARYYVQQIYKKDIPLRTSTTITGWDDTTTLTYSSPQGIGTIEAQTVLLATGCRERPRSSRLIPGSRPTGIFTTGSLQRFVDEHHLPIGKQAVIVGAELVSLSALITLRQAGVKVTKMITEYPKHQIYLPYVPIRWLLMDTYARTGIVTNAKISNIFGKRRVEGVEIIHRETGETDIIDCDTMVFTGGWIPENELARRGGLTIDIGTKGPRIDSAYRTSIPGIFAAGNLLHGAETADISALEGRHSALHIREYLSEGNWVKQPIPIHIKQPIYWITPNCISDLSMARKFSFRVSQFLKSVVLLICQGDRVLFQQHFRTMQPNKTYHLSGHWVHSVGASSEPLVVRMAT